MRTAVRARRPVLLVLAFAFVVTAGACFRDPAAPNPPDDDDGVPDPGAPAMVAMVQPGGAPFWIA
jgi:hypothetical protein